MRNDCPSCDSTIKDLTKGKRELNKLLNEANAQIAVYREALEAIDNTVVRNSILGKICRKTLSLPPSELLERVKKLEFAVNKSIKYVEKVQREEFQLTGTFEWNSMLREALK